MFTIKYLLSINHVLEDCGRVVPERRTGEKIMANVLPKYDRTSHVKVKWALVLCKGGHLGASIIHGNTSIRVTHLQFIKCFKKFIPFHPHHAPVRKRLSCLFNIQRSEGQRG